MANRTPRKEAAPQALVAGAPLEITGARTNAPLLCCLIGRTATVSGLTAAEVAAILGRQPAGQNA